jgi:hypothetical protein
MCKVIAILCLCLFSSPQDTQSSQTSDRKASGQKALWQSDDNFKNMAEEVSASGNVTDRDLLARHTKIVQASDRQMRTKFEAAGFNDKAIYEIELMSWKDLAVTDKYFTADSFQNYAQTHYGVLRVESKPTGANVWVNNSDWGTTTQEKGVMVGKKHIRLHLDRYQDSEGDVEVTPVKITIFAGILTKLKHAGNPGDIHDK